MSKYMSERFNMLEAYTPGEQPQNRKYIKLNTNESPFPPSPRVTEAINADEIGALMLYPDPQTSRLIEVISEHYGVDKSEVILGNGSDEILAFSFFAFCDKMPGACFSDITYGFYEVYTDLYGFQKEIIPLGENFRLIPESFYGKNKTIFIANPNAPTGICLKLEEIEEIIRRNPDNVVVIDEAYIDFGGESAVPLIHKYDNLLVVQTFSKSRCLAGARLGMAVGNKKLIADLNKIKFSFNPYNINRLTLLAGEAAMKDTAYFEGCVSKIINIREHTAEKLKSMGFMVLPSKTNFLFAAHDTIDGGTLYAMLKEKGILVRHFDKKRISNFLRITIGSSEEMKKLIEIIQEF